MSIETKLGSSLDDLIARQKKEHVQRKKRPGPPTINPNVRYKFLCRCLLSPLPPSRVDNVYAPSLQAPTNKRIPGAGPPRGPGGPPNARRNQPRPGNASVPPLKHGGVQKPRHPKAAPHNPGPGRRHEGYVDPNSGTNIPSRPAKTHPGSQYGSGNPKWQGKPSRHPGAHAVHSTPPPVRGGPSFAAGTRPRPPVPTHVSFRKHNAYRDELYGSTKEPLHSKFDSLHQQSHAGPSGYPLVNAHGMVVPA